MGARATAAQLADGETAPWVKDALCRAHLRTYPGEQATQAEQRVYTQCIDRLYPDRKAIADQLGGMLMLAAVLVISLLVVKYWIVADQR